ncbi:hypothetical protein HY480_03405 [Candidatus Uhrbacteria bacterium]|nr:hypothetical protein [Candidatus Uhrbacteria bacterium]
MTIAIASFIAVAVTSMLVLDLRLRVAATQLRDVETDADNAIHALDGVLRAGATIQSTGTVGGRDTVTFDIPTVTAAGVVLGTRDRITITPNGTQPERVELQVTPAVGSRLPSGTRTIARHATAFHLQYHHPTPANARALTITMTSAITAGGYATSATRATVVALRNIP